MPKKETVNYYMWVYFTTFSKKCGIKIPQFINL